MMFVIVVRLVNRGAPDRAEVWEVEYPTLGTDSPVTRSKRNRLFPCDVVVAGRRGCVRAWRGRDDCRCDGSSALRAGCLRRQERKGSTRPNDHQVRTHQNAPVAVEELLQNRIGNVVIGQRVTVGRKRSMGRAVVE